ncbi:N-acetylmuramoyl-L-alanine amidase [uncultured Mitsuokella sp.]|uniref:N-acetylmuramoyl-L-alanine amidase family protein n=1 Tax=uncultured Mitsuokella sp. TaxID=453120 RepID=UPI0025E63BCA|nr:N-acetylmuramoyl-L-alanine amidase [uncultured Mitsuokella sp.]
MNIFINPGHSLDGHPDPGAVNEELGITESESNAVIAENCAIALERYGYTVKIVQSHNLRGESPAYPNVTGLANHWPADLFLSIHANAGGGRGCETYCYHDASWSNVLAHYVQNTLHRNVSRIDKTFPNRGVKINPALAVLRCTAMPAILVETGFIDNDQDVQLIHKYPAIFGHGIAYGTHLFLNDFLNPDDDAEAYDLRMPMVYIPATEPQV